MGLFFVVKKPVENEMTEDPKVLTVAEGDSSSKLDDAFMGELERRITQQRIDPHADVPR